jgi:SAM-dependent methyltransferase
VLINPESSVFGINDFISHHDTFFNTTAHGGIAKLLRLVPSIGKNIKGRPNFRRFSNLLLQQSTLPLVLVIGGSVLGEGMDFLAGNKAIALVETDVSFGPRTMLICDAHDIPFRDASFDGVVLQAVLEHVIDPYRCSEEVYRVSKEQALVYAETPFMQQVHAGRYDFTRFTHLGHRRLFRRFQEIDSGAVCGPGMALAWSYQYFLMSFATSRPLRAALRVFASMTSFFLKYFDYYLIEKPGALDAASGLYFMGRKTGQMLSDLELLKLYKGAQRSGGA